MNTLSKLFSFVLLVALCLIPTGLVSAAITDPPLDEFNDNQSLELTFSGSQISGVNAVSGSMIGGERDIYATIYNGNNGETLFATVNNANSSFLNITSGTNIRYTVSVQYDGSGDTNKEEIDTTSGLGGIDLTQGGNRDRFILAIPFTDLGAPVRIRVYSSNTQCTQRSVTPGNINNLKPKLFEFLLSSSGASVCSGYSSHANFASVRAIEIFVDANSGPYASTDMVMDLITTVKPPYLDYGDLPDSYDVDYEGYSGSARHIVRGPRLGSGVTEETTKPTVDGGADEDTDDPGVVPLDKWQPGQTEQVQVTVSNCSSTCYIDAWIDWNLDDDFWNTDTGLNWDADEHVLKSAAVANGVNTLNITVPSGVTIANTSFYVRFRISDRNNGTQGTAWWFYYSGEVEDYLWSFGPTAVPVAKLLARGEQPSWTWGLALFGLALGAVLMFKRRLR